MLRRRRQIPAERGGAGTTWKRVEQSGKTATQRCKQLLKPSQGEIRFERLRQGFPATARFRQLTGLLLAQIHHLPQRWSKDLKVRGRFGLLPEVVSLRFGGGESTDQGRVQCLLATQILLEQIKIAGLLLQRTSLRRTGAGLPLSASIRNQIGVALRTLTGMQLTRQQGQLLATPSSTAARHARVLIPVERALDRAKQLGFLQVLAKACPGVGGRTAIHRSSVSPGGSNHRQCCSSLTDSPHPSRA